MVMNKIHTNSEIHVHYEHELWTDADPLMYIGNR